MYQTKRDKNLLVVVAAEQYAHKYKITTSSAFSLFQQNGISDLIRKHYGVLHTQPMEESFHFADDVLKRLIK
jgi:hypothetical protein